MRPSNLAPSTASWRVNREAALVLVGGRALLMQLAHPRVAAGVAEHSDFRRRPIRRLARTLDLTQQLTFGDEAEAMAAARTINGVHRRVRGAGYSASDPDLLLWVQATLIDSALLAYREFVGPLARRDAEAYYREAIGLAALLGLPRDRWPDGLAGFDRYMAAMIASPELRVDDRARSLARSVLRPRIGVIPPAAWYPSVAVTAALLPEPLRTAYGLHWRRRERAVFTAVRRAVRGAVPHLPAALRYVPPARRAAARWHHYDPNALRGERARPPGGAPAEGAPEGVEQGGRAD